ncbi:solute carrier family 25 member 44-like isoform X1 [Acanthaster planci]|uniref:Solute carrier family 25 member 44-like isoform X1 n=1 Tax=Acanthaster planci TaxID=133434 RepID=A0A8B7XXS2_ACAPL|nr:solute carrier family 25 member 44-like isoform X1 [Acanthaster planci]XP_022084592.1 solute carrier family 25 member 44-like isoform X1 [Acanthaster planci]
MEPKERQIRILEWDDLDKRKFYTFGFMMSMFIRVTIYPTTLIKTRLQVQTKNAMYSGTWDAFKKITKYEGVRGLYKGFLINTFTILSGQVYITTYEVTRRAFGNHASNTTKSFVGGACASLVAQSVTVPIDIISQHVMMEGSSLSLEAGRRKVTFRDAQRIIHNIWHKDGPIGFYKGYTASIMTFMPNSALWWPFYHFYAGHRGYLHFRDLQETSSGGGDIRFQERAFSPASVHHSGWLCHRRLLRNSQEAEHQAGSSRQGPVVRWGVAWLPLWYQCIRENVVCIKTALLKLYGRNFPHTGLVFSLNFVICEVRI